MKHVRATTARNGKRQITIELDDDEYLLTLREGAFYKLGQPMDEVVAAHVIREKSHVTWCSASQEWRPG